MTNYSVDKPSYAFSSATTEFDDALMKRGVVTHEQAIMAKGASAEEAQRLAALAKSGKERQLLEGNNARTKDEDSEEDSDFDDDDDEFLQQYRQQRIAELKQEQNTEANATANSTSKIPRFGDVIPIQRPEWTYHVNEASHDAWVVVVLTSSNVELTGSTEAAVATLAHCCPSVKFVTIPSTSAIANFPDANLPAAFLYKNGSMVHELVGGGGVLKRVTTPLQLMRVLSTAGVEFGSQEQQQVQEYSQKSDEGRRDVLRRRMMMLDEEEGDDDEVL